MKERLAVLLALFVLVAAWEYGACCLTLNGSPPPFQSLGQPKPSQGPFYSSLFVLSPATNFTCSGRVTSFQAYMERSSTTYNLVIFQVLTPVSSCSYILRGEQRVQNYQVGGDYLLDSAPLSPISVAPGDIVGIYVEHAQRNVGVQQYSGDNSLAFGLEGEPTSTMVDCGTVSYMGAPIVNAEVELDPVSTTPAPEVTTPAPQITTSPILTTTSTPSVSSTSPTDPMSTDPTPPISSSTSPPPVPTTSPTSSPSPATSSPPPMFTTSSVTIPSPPTTPQFIATTASTMNSSTTTSISSEPPLSFSSTTPSDATSPTNTASTIASTDTSASVETDTEIGDSQLDNSISSEVVIGLVVVLLLVVVAISIGFFGMCAVLLCRKSKENHLRRDLRSINPSFDDQNYYHSDPNAVAMRKLEDIESSGIYDQVGPSCESKLDYQMHAAALRDGKSELPAIPPPRCGNAYEAPNKFNVGGTTNTKQKGPSQTEALDVYEVVEGANGNTPDIFLQSEDYEVPVETKSNTLKPNRREGTAKKPNGKVIKLERRNELEVSNMYETPLDAEERREKKAATKKGMTSRSELEASNVYDTPLDAAERRAEAKRKEAEAAEELEQEYTPMASVWNYTQYKRT